MPINIQQLLAQLLGGLSAGQFPVPPPYLPRGLLGGQFQQAVLQAEPQLQQARGQIGQIPQQIQDAIAAAQSRLQGGSLVGMLGQGQTPMFPGMRISEMQGRLPPWIQQQGQPPGLQGRLPPWLQGGVPTGLQGRPPGVGGLGHRL